MFSILLTLAALGSGLMAGFFFAFSILVMPSFARLPAPQAIAAMNTINVVVLNPWFFTGFFGTALTSIAIALLFFTSTLALAGALVYLFGTIGVTMAFNVPLNNALAKVPPDTVEGAAFWIRYHRVWTGWNHVRTIAPLTASALFIMALLQPPH